MNDMEFSDGVSSDKDGEAKSADKSTWVTETLILKEQESASSNLFENKFDPAQYEKQYMLSPIVSVSSPTFTE